MRRHSAQSPASSAGRTKADRSFRNSAPMAPATSQPRPRHWSTPPDPGSLMAQIAAHSGDALWREPTLWTHSHLDFLRCRFVNRDGKQQVQGAAAPNSDETSNRDAPPPEATTPPRRPLSVVSRTSQASSQRRQPHSHADSLRESLRDATKSLRMSLDWQLSRARARVGGAAGGSDAYSRLLSSSQGGDGAYRNLMMEKILAEGTGLEFLCKEMALWLFVDGSRRASVDIVICLPSERRQSRLSRANLAQKLGRAPAGGPATPPIFPATAAIVGKGSKAVTLLRGLALGFVELGDIERLREDRYPFRRLEAELNMPTAAVVRKKLQGIIPAVRQHDPYLLAIFISMAQAQASWRSELSREEIETLRSRGEGWICDGGYTAHLIVTDERDSTGLFVYSVTIPADLLDMLKHPRRAPCMGSSSSSGSSAGSGGKFGRLSRDELLVRYQKVPHLPATDFPKRLAQAIDQGCEARPA